MYQTLAAARRPGEADMFARADIETGGVQKAGADIVAIGGFAHSRIRAIVLGSVTRAVVRGVDCPVLISG